MKHVPEYPDFLIFKLKAFQEFFQMETKSEDRVHEGLYQTFKENFPITDTVNQFVPLGIS